MTPINIRIKAEGDTVNIISESHAEWDYKWIKDWRLWALQKRINPYASFYNLLEN